MKLKDFIIKRKLLRKSSKDVSKNGCQIEDSIIDYEVEPRVLYSKHDSSRDDCSEVKMRNKSKSCGAIRSPPKTHSLTCESNMFSKTIEKSCQTTNRMALSCEIDFNYNNKFSRYIDHKDGLELEPTQHSTLKSKKSDTISENYQTRDNNNWCQNFHSLPLNQSQCYHSQTNDSSKSHSINCKQTLQLDINTNLNNQQCFDTYKKNKEPSRCRIRTNPWIPVPRTPYQIQQRPNVDRKREPRLSRFISEVEEIMRAQYLMKPPPTDELSRKSCSSSTLSLASTCSTETEIPEKKESDNSPMRSPSEGYKSACDSESNLADTESICTSDLIESFSTTSIMDSNGHISGPSVLPPSLEDFEKSLHIEPDYKLKGSISNASHFGPFMTESMFSSTVSLKSEVFRERVRKLCQSTTQLDEKIRLARLECSYIQVK